MSSPTEKTGNTEKGGEAIKAKLTPDNENGRSFVNGLGKNETARQVPKKFYEDDQVYLVEEQSRAILFKVSTVGDNVDPQTGEWMYKLKDHSSGIVREGWVAESSLALAKSRS